MSTTLAPEGRTERIAKLRARIAELEEASVERKLAEKLKRLEAEHEHEEMLASGETPIAHFTRARVVQHLGSEVQASDLFNHWREWCGENGEFPGSARRLSQQLEALGYHKARKAGGTYYQGIRLL